MFSYIPPTACLLLILSWPGSFPLYFNSFRKYHYILKISLNLYFLSTSRVNKYAFCLPKVMAWEVSDPWPKPSSEKTQAAGLTRPLLCDNCDSLGAS